MVAVNKYADFFDYANVPDIQGEGSKGWTYSYVYYFKEIRDIFLIIREAGDKTKKEIYDSISQCIQTEGNPWNDRRILEHINALINFGLIDKNRRVLREMFIKSKINSSISQEDLQDFEEIFFSYQRFLDFISLFDNDILINSIRNNPDKVKELCLLESSRVYAFFQGQKYFNAFIANGSLVKIPDTHKHVMRFWEVFTKWGKSLGLIEKVLTPVELLPYADETLLKDYKQTVNTVYFIKPGECTDKEIALCVEKNFLTNYIYIPKLIVLLAIQSRRTINSAKEGVIRFYSERRESITIERTSEIFIEKSYRPFFPMFNGSFVSHLLLKR